MRSFLTLAVSSRPSLIRCGSSMEAPGAAFSLSRSVPPAPSAAFRKAAQPLCLARTRPLRVATAELERNSAGVPNSNYVVPLDNASSSLTRPLNEILRDLNKRAPAKIVDTARNSIPWYHTNRMLCFYAPGWCGEVRDVVFSDNGLVTVVYRVTIRGSDGEAHREATGTVSTNDAQSEDAVAAAEELAFCKACAKFGFGLYLYHQD